MITLQPQAIEVFIKNINFTIAHQYYEYIMYESFL